MLPIHQLLDAPKSFEFVRNSKSIVATRHELSPPSHALSRVTIADAMAPEEFTPIRVAKSEYRCLLYQWSHPRGVINVCAAIVPTSAARGRIVELSIKQTFAPHVPGLPVDSGEIVMDFGGNKHVIESGLGDGYYPVYGCKPMFRRPTAIVVDFKIWQTRDNVILLNNQRFDEYGIVCFDDE